MSEEKKDKTFHVIYETILKNFEFLKHYENDERTIKMIQGLNKILNYKVCCLGENAVPPGKQNEKKIINMNRLKSNKKEEEGNE